MENKKNTEPAEDSGWFDHLLSNPDLSDELGPDEHAVSSAGLSDLSDMEFEKIMQETLQETWPDDPIVEEVSAPVLDELYSDADPEALSITPAADDAEPEDEQVPLPSPAEASGPVRKVRPKRKKGYGLFGIPHILSTAIWLVIAIAIGVSMGRLLWVCATDILAFGKPDKTITVTITNSDDIDSITDKLYNAGLIEYPQLFKLYATITDAQESISAGTFELNSMFDYHALVGSMSATSSYRETIKVVIPEGYSCAQIYSLLEEKGVCSAEAMEQYAAESDFADYWFLQDIKRGSKYCLEGFLFPDTYEFYTNDSPKRVFIKLLSRFEDQFDEDLRNHIVTLNERLSAMMLKNGYDQTFINANQMDLYDVLKVASMIEKESAHTGENYSVSSVIYNRLTNRKAFPCLQIDATIVYALGGKSDLTDADLKLDSPYNSYLYAGLPPTPISNPGISAIMAALSPGESDYYYYALNPATGEHHFSKTYQEHLDFLNSLK